MMSDKFEFFRKIKHDKSKKIGREVLPMRSQSHPKMREKSRPPYGGRASHIWRACVPHMKDARPTYGGRDFSQGFR